MSLFPDWGSVPTRPRCHCCERKIVADIQVPDELWAAVMHPSKRNGYVCLDCFADRADEKMIDWAAHIEITPLSLFSQVRAQGWKLVRETPRELAEQLYAQHPTYHGTRALAWLEAPNEVKREWLDKATAMLAAAPSPTTEQPTPPTPAAAKR